ncbi:poly(A)-specific ribonuclease [Ranunculus cassubicifolius]
MAEQQLVLTVNFYSSTPVVGIEITPRVHLFPIHGNNYTYQFTWYRLVNEKVNCHVHESERASVQCSTKCYNDTGEYHLENHSQSAAKLNSTSNNANDETGKSFRCGSMSDDAIVDDQDGRSWLKVASSKNYVPSTDDFGCILRLVTVVVEASTSDVKLTDRVIGVPSLPCPRIIQIPQVGSSSEAHVFSLTIRVLSYNILTDHWAKTSDAQGNLSDYPKWCRTWEYRRENLLREIIAYDADIICLQEVQDDHFEKFLKPKLQQHGYSVTYKLRKNGNFDIDERITVKDGCATCFRSAKFTKLQEFELEYNRYAEAVLNKLPPSQRELGRSRLLKDNIASVITLKPNGIWNPSENFDYTFSVANTHIYADEDFKDAKLFQVATLVTELESLSLPVLLCGDLNSRPESAPYDFVARGKVDPDHLQFPADPSGIFGHLKLSHNLLLVSAYSAIHSLAPERHRSNMKSRTREQFTHFSKRFSGTLDYIFYSEDRFRLKGVLEIPDKDSIGEKQHIPSPLRSSDHVAIMAELWLTPTWAR